MRSPEAYPHSTLWRTLSAAQVIFFVIMTLIVPEQAKGIFDGLKTWPINNFDWLFMVGSNIFVIFCLALIFFPVGKTRIGGANALGALQATAITVSLPFTVVFLDIHISFYNALYHKLQPLNEKGH